jgi:hypothetical protein
MVLAETESYVAILNDLRNAGVNSVIFTGGGEPLLNPDLPALAHKAAEVGLKWGLFTNGHTATDPMIEQLLAAEPRFVRISINAGSDVKYENEYRLGVGSYRIVRENVIRFAGASSRASQRCVGLNYALDGFVGSGELAGIVDFVSEVMETTSGALATVAFRPKVVYFDARGKTRAHQPRASVLRDLAHRIRDEVVAPLRSRFDGALRIDHKFGMFLRAASGAIQPMSQATPWTSQMDHRGVGFITSELNGTPWPGFDFGAFDGGNFVQTWFSDRRLALMKEFASGSGRVPVHHKIAHIDTLLLDVRNAVGVMSEMEIRDFWERLEIPTRVLHQNWDFL